MEPESDHVTLAKSRNFFSSESYSILWEMWGSSATLLKKCIGSRWLKSYSFRHGFIQGPKDATRFCPLVLLSPALASGSGSIWQLWPQPHTITTRRAAKENVYPQLTILTKSRDSLCLDQVKSCAYPEPSSVAKTLNAWIDLTHSPSVY